MFGGFGMTSREGFCTLEGLCDLKHHRGEKQDFLTDFPRCGQRESGKSEALKSQFSVLITTESDVLHHLILVSPFDP